MRYRFDQLRNYDPGDHPCPICGGPPRVEWISADTSADPPGTWYMPGMLTCRACEARDTVAVGALGDAQQTYVDRLP